MAFAQQRNDVAIKTKVDTIRAAELDLANARADGLAKLQASLARLPADQVPVLTAALERRPRAAARAAAVKPLAAACLT